MPAPGSHRHTLYQSDGTTGFLSPLLRGPSACALSTPRVPPPLLGGRLLLLAYPSRELTEVLFPLVCSWRVHLPGSLRSPGVTRLRRYYGPSDSGAGQPPAPGSPLIPCSLPDVPAPPTSAPTCRQYWQSLDRDRFTADAAGFAFFSQARPGGMPYRGHLRSGPTLRLRLL